MDEKEAKIYKCDLCNYKSEWDFALKHHQDHHRITPKSLQMFDCTEEPKKYECTSCDYRTTMSIQLMQHIQTEHKSKTLPLINLVVYSDNDIERPLVRRSHSKVKKEIPAIEKKPIVVDIKENAEVQQCIELKCFNCDFLKFSEMFLVKHTGPDCNPKFIKLEHLSADDDQGVSESIRRVVDLHKQLGTNVTVYQFKCLHCYREHDENLRAIAILKGMHMLKCYHCSYETNNKMYLKGHIKNMHTLPEKIVWFKCEYCAFKTKNKDQVKRHMTYTHTDQRDFPCDLCAYKAKYKNHLEHHMLNMHTGLRPFACSKCPYKAKNKTALNYHFKSRHLDESEINWFYCDNCNYKARWKHLIRLHSINRHMAPEDIKWHKCPYCTYKAKRSTHLKLHLGKKHGQHRFVGKSKEVDVKHEMKVKS